MLYLEMYPLLAENTQWHSGPILDRKQQQIQLNMPNDFYFVSHNNIVFLT